MRGMLRIASSRAPYQRAGIGFATKGPQEVDIRTLDGERFLRLVKDPVLMIKIGQEDGSFIPLPALPADIDAEQMQLLVDGLTSELPTLDTISLVGADSFTLEGTAEKLAAAGVTTIDGLFDKLAATKAELDRLELDYAELRDRADAVTLELAQRNSHLAERDNDLSLCRQRVAELEAALTAASSSQPGELPSEVQAEEIKPAPRKPTAKKG